MKFFLLVMAFVSALVFFSCGIKGPPRPSQEVIPPATVTEPQPPVAPVIKPVSKTKKNKKSQK